LVIVRPARGRAGGGVLAERIRHAVADQRFEVTGSDVRLEVTVSIGVAEHRAGDGEDPQLAAERLLARADVALYEVKTGGRNGVAHAANA
jgi:diguanylate cyclase (GGDEF)-like protein